MTCDVIMLKSMPAFFPVLFHTRIPSRLSEQIFNPCLFVRIIHQHNLMPLCMHEILLKIKAFMYMYIFDLCVMYNFYTLK